MTTKQNDAPQKLIEYFEGREDVMMAFLFGSHARNQAHCGSDWDIAVYFNQLTPEIDHEADRVYAQENNLREELSDLLEADNLDLVVLNNAPADIAASAIKGLPLTIKNRRIYLEFMLIVTQDAEDYRQTAKEYAQTYWRSQSLSEEDKSILNRRILFLDSEMQDASKFKKLTQLEYEKDNTKRREAERWVENLVNVSIDIAKVLLASSKKPIPSTYRKILLGVGTLPGFNEDLSQQLARWSELRNILAHEYLDIRWKRIEDFIQKSEPYFRKLIETVKPYIMD